MCNFFCVILEHFVILDIILQLLCGAGNWDAEHWVMFFKQHMNDQMIREIQKLEDAETIVDSCLKVLLMETACLGIDSSKCRTILYRHVSHSVL
jgi:hypothetical protein